MADEHKLFWHLAVANTDILDQPDMHRVFEKRMKVEQYKDAGLRDRSDVFEYFAWLRIERLRFENNVEALQTVRDRPAKKWQIFGG